MANPITAASGWQWFLEALRALRAQPLALTGIVVFYILISGILSGIPFVGTLAAGVWMPFGAVLVGFAARDSLAGKVPLYAVLTAALRKPGLRLQLTAVGLLYAVYMEAMMLVFQLLAKDDLSKWVINDKGIDFASVTANFPLTSVIVTFVLYVPLLMATIFSPLLAADAGQTVGKSFFYSFFGVWRNLGACLAALFLIGFLTAGAGFAANALFLALGIESYFAYAAPLIVVMLTTISQSMVWPMYRDIFGEKRLFDSLG